MATATVDVLHRPPAAPPTWFHPAVAAWFRRRFPEGPTAPQSLGWEEIAAGRDTLIAAPTGSGKTLAGFLVAIDRLYREAVEAPGLVTGTRVLYISPLKALAVDVADNLTGPLGGIARTAAEMGIAVPPVTVAVRTGDTAAGERASLLRRAPSILATTPESLYLLLTSERGRGLLRRVATVIVDEIHALARDKRGAHLALSLERLEALADRRPQRIGLSATQRPIETTARLLVGDRPPPAIVDVGHHRALDLALELPGSQLEAVASAAQLGEVLDRIAALVAEHRTTIVFVNTRRLAERLAHQLSQRLGDDAVAAHHGSLSKERRHRVEARLRRGELRALVATASLELGIDVGPVELVCQIGSPRRIATLVQRVGRANHSRSGIPKGRLFPLTRDELVECTALLAAVAEGRLDALRLPSAPLDVAAQQIVAEVAAREWDVEGLYRLVRRAAPYADLSRERFAEVLSLVSHGIETGIGPRGRWLHHDTGNGRLRPRRGARLAALTSGGAIPETADYRVVAEPDDTLIGTVNEDWAVESLAGDVFLLGTHSWQIVRVEPQVVRVRDAGDALPTVPFWLGEAPARSDELSEEVSRLRRTVDAFLAAGDAVGARSWLAAIPGVDERAAREIVAYLACGRAALGVLPTQEDCVVERFFDDTGGMQLVLHAPFGARINRGLGLVLRKKFCRAFDVELQAAATDDAVLLSLGPHHSFPLEDVADFLRTPDVRDLLEHAVVDSPMFLTRWRWNCTRALLVLRWQRGRRTPPPLQRLAADDLLVATFPQATACQDNRSGPVVIPDHCLVRQTLDDTLTEALDVEGLEALLRRLGSGAVRLHTRETTEPSVLSHEVVSARPYAFLDDEELQNRRVTAVRLRRGLPSDLRDLAALDPAAIDRVHREIAPDPATADELHDLLATTVLLPPREEWRPLLDTLRAEGRAAVVAGPRGELWAATELLAQAQAALAGEEAAVVRALRGHLDLAGVTTPASLAATTGIALARVAVGLAALEGEGVAMRGRFSPGAAGEEWVSRRLLARMHAYSRRARRAAVDPVGPEELMRFLLTWHHVAPGSEVRGPRGVLEVVEQLQGVQVPAGVWESEILSRRVRPYLASWLDAWCHSGDVAWLRLALRAAEGAPAPVVALPSRTTPVALVLRADLPWLLAAARSGGEPPVPAAGATAEVVDVLRARGASFATELEQATARLPDDVERALWDAVARGLVMGDGFAAIRARVLGAGRGRHRRRGRGEWLLGARRRLDAAPGRWSLVPPADPSLDRDDLAEAVATQLLRRWGVLFRTLAARDDLRLPWRQLLWALRRLEDRGLVAGGRFVAGVGGEQFALPAAVDALAQVRHRAPSGERVVVNATDPLNLVGVVVPGPPVPQVHTREVVYVDGVPETSSPVRC